MGEWDYVQRDMWGNEHEPPIERKPSIRTDLQNSSRLEERRMNYLSEINAFENWCEFNPLSTSAQLLWYKLIALNNKAGWIEWFTATNPYLMVKIGVSSESNFINIRNNLKQAGLLDFKSGKKGQPTKYKLCFFTSKYEVKTEVKSEVKAEVKSEGQTEDINKDIDLDIKEKDKKKKVDKDKSKIQYAEFVRMLPEEHEKLISEFGESATKYLIETLDNYKGAYGKAYKSDYRAILTWPRRELEKNNKSLIHSPQKAQTAMNFKPVIEEGL